MSLNRLLVLLASSALALPLWCAAELPPLPTRGQLDAGVRDAMAATQARGLALAVIDQGRVVHVVAHGERNAAGQPLQTETVMYGASLTKMVFGYTVMQLVEEGRLQLDRPIAELLPKPLPEYGNAPG